MKHPLTAAMIGLDLFAVLVGALATPRLAMAQSAYEKGMRDGYNDAYPVGGPPPITTEYGRGFQSGQDDSDDDDEAQRRLLAPPIRTTGGRKAWRRSDLDAWVSAGGIDGFATGDAMGRNPWD